MAGEAVSEARLKEFETPVQRADRLMFMGIKVPLPPHCWQLVCSVLPKKRLHLRRTSLHAPALVSPSQRPEQRQGCLTRDHTYRTT